MSKINQWFSEAYKSLRNALEKATDKQGDEILFLSLHNPTVTLLLSIFLGAIGVDRFVLGDVGRGILKLLFGWLTLGIFPLIDIYFSYQRAKKINFGKVKNILEQA